MTVFRQLYCLHIRLVQVPLVYRACRYGEAQWLIERSDCVCTLHLLFVLLAAPIKEPSAPAAELMDVGENDSDVEMQEISSVATDDSADSGAIREKRTQCSVATCKTYVPKDAFSCATVSGIITLKSTCAKKLLTDCLLCNQHASEQTSLHDAFVVRA